MSLRCQRHDLHRVFGRGAVEVGIEVFQAMAVEQVRQKREPIQLRGGLGQVEVFERVEPRVFFRAGAIFVEGEREAWPRSQGIVPEERHLALLETREVDRAFFLVVTVVHPVHLFEQGVDRVGVDEAQVGICGRLAPDGPLVLCGDLGVCALRGAWAALDAVLICQALEVRQELFVRGLDGDLGKRVPDAPDQALVGEVSFLLHPFFANWALPLIVYNKPGHAYPLSLMLCL